jgi:RNA polymerase sigma-70 factor, ECF subfamily
MKGDEAEHGEAEFATALVSRIENGDAEAEAELVGHYSPGLLFLLRRMTGRPELADDLHQDTFRVVLERLRGSGLQDPSRLGGFIRRTARNLFIADYRKTDRRRDGSLEDAEPPADQAPDPLRQAVLDEDAAIVRQLVAELQPDRDRQVLYRYYLAEEDKPAICDDLGLSSLHFNRVLYRARQRFKKLLEESRHFRKSDVERRRPTDSTAGPKSSGWDNRSSRDRAKEKG